MLGNDGLWHSRKKESATIWRFFDATAPLSTRKTSGQTQTHPPVSAGGICMSETLINIPPDTVEDGYELWLRYRRWPAAQAATLQARARAVCLPGADTPMLDQALAELARGVHGLAGQRLARLPDVADGCLLLLTPERLRAWSSAGTHAAIAQRASQAFETLLNDTAGGDATLANEAHAVVAFDSPAGAHTLLLARTDRGLLYAAHAWLRALRELAPGADPASIHIEDAPRIQLRVLNHWDNLDRTVERGYAGASIWDWWKLPHIIDARYEDYGRACASLGINAVALNNVNAKPEVLSAPWLAKAAALANALRPHGLRVLLSVRFSSPMELGGLPTADPLDEAVQAWWRDKAAEVYALIPDFGGFLVKANSEGQPGPRDYGRNHAEGANAVAQALAPHGGYVFWRAFVYSESNPRDRHTQAYTDFAPLDGQFLPNVIVQVKNGAIDFQPREPFHPLFGAMPNTPLAIELMVTKEYMGFSTHLAYQGAVYEEVLGSDTGHVAAGSAHSLSVAGVVQRRTSPNAPTAVAGVANVGCDRSWCGSHFEQANWYAWGRLAWNPQASAQAIAREWAVQTFGSAAPVVQATTSMLALSREAVVNYMTPLGLHHIMATGHHHGPGPWVSELARPEWNPVYYHRADAHGIGFDRTASGSDALAQYAPSVGARWGSIEQCPENLLLWFHHCRWNHRLADGQELWPALVRRYDQGVQQAAQLVAQWEALRGHIDARRHHETAQHLAQQQREAQWWRDACVCYFQTVSGLPLPAGSPQPARTLAEYRAIRQLHAPGCGG